MTPAPDGLPPLREVIAKYGLRARKSLGQNFLLDFNLTRRIARAAGAGDSGNATILEVGAGPGGLTRALLMEGAGRVVVIEKDRRCLAALEDIAAAYPGRLDIIAGDAMTVDAGALFATAEPVRLVANLPYNISTALLAKWLTTEPWPPWFTGLTLMFQREVAARIAAPPGARDYGRLSVLCGWRTEAHILFDVSPRAFVPEPKVMSSLVRLDLRAEPLAPAPPEVLRRVVATAFGQRRKMLRSSLKQLAPDIVGLLRDIGIDPRDRPESVTIPQFCALARAVAKSGNILK